MFLENLGLLIQLIVACLQSIALFLTIFGLLLLYFQIVQSRKDTDRNLALSSYKSAIQMLLLMKKTFAENKHIFNEQVVIGGFEGYIPPGMRGDKGDTFLIFAAGMWELSYVYSIVRRWKELGLNEYERDALLEEMKLWLKLPGFREVYDFHTKPLKVHNREFLEFLKGVYPERPEENP